MRASMIWVGVSLFLLVHGCAPSVRGRPFNNSSADFNGSALHRLRTPGDVESVADAVLSIMEDRGAQLVRRRNTERGVLLSFRFVVERLQGTRSQSTGAYTQPTQWFRVGTFSSETVTEADYVAFGALYYVEIVPIDEGVAVQAIGLPVIDGITACPDLVAFYRKCRPATSKDEASFAENVEDKAGIDVSGRNEAEVLSALIAQLQRKRWQDRFLDRDAQSPVRKNSPPSPAIEDAFEDKAGDGPTSN